MGTPPLNLIESMDMMDASQLDELMTQMEHQVSKRPKDIHTMLLLGNALYLRGKINDAISIYQRAISVNPRLPLAYYWLGVCYYRSADLNKAIETLKHVIELSSDILMAYYWLGISYWHKGQFKDGLEAFETLIEKNHDSHIAHFHAALCCIEEKCWDKAATHLEALVDITTQDSRVYYYLGNVYYQQYKIPEAIAAYEKGLELSPNNPQMLAALQLLTSQKI